MKHNFFSLIYLTAATTMGIGAAYHSLGCIQKIKPFAGATPADQVRVQHMVSVWHFAGASMFIFCILVFFIWFRLRRGEKSLFFIPALIGIFYFLHGIATVLYTGLIFFIIYTVTGILLFLSSMLLTRE